ncbi:MAG: hypothetical protein LBE18_10925 [Planctomycetaceae bacterium]|jgi:hypothetical protein|nr:hypothetical protein [Planctomycetaceae bacterium]
MTVMTNMKDISANNDLDFYLDKKNIRRQELVTDTIDYIRTIAKKLFEPVEFLNLLWQQKQFVNKNYQNPNLVVNTLRSLPLTDAQKHVLYCFLLKWQGGYPVELFIYNMNGDALIPNAYKSIEEEFLRYKDNTPEKEYCHRSFSQHELIDKIHAGTLFEISYINYWANGEMGGFVYEEAQNYYRFVEMKYNQDRGMYERLSPYNPADLTNFPIKAKGFVAFLIHKWGMVEAETDYYRTYYEPLLRRYKTEEQIKPGAARRNLEAEFRPSHIQNEQDHIKFSQSSLFPFLRESEAKTIQSYVDNYLEYIKTQINTATRPLETSEKPTNHRNKADTGKPAYDYSQVLENYIFWNNQNDRIQGRVNIFRDITEQQFISMIDNADFSAIDKKGYSQRVKYNIVVLARILGEEWGEKAASKLNTTLRECGKKTTFAEYNGIKSMYLT